MPGIFSFMFVLVPLITVGIIIFVIITAIKTSVVHKDLTSEIAKKAKTIIENATTTAPHKNGKTCEYCNTINDNDAKKCENCGASLNK